jgi:dTDP-glucose pyrophosphorylase
MKERIRQLVISEQATVRDALLAIDSGSLQIALVTDAEDRLLFTVTDGDIRRALLAGIGPDSPVLALGGKPPRTIAPDVSDSEARQIMRQQSLHHLPVVDAGGRLLDLIYVDDLSGLRPNDTRVVLMAGGLGTRLRPLTAQTPKPMLRLGDRPILETIIRSLSDQGFSNLTISLNYRGDQIRDHFGDGRRFGVEITYVEEKERLGTAGALTLLPDRPQQPFIVMNADLLTTIRYEALVNFHREQTAKATVCAWEYSHQVPYGVLQTDDTRLVAIEEKPTRVERVSAGIYVLSPEVLDLLDGPTYTDMPDLLQRLMNAGDPVSVFAMRETWIDIGRIEDLEQARAHVEKSAGPDSAS